MARGRGTGLVTGLVVVSLVVLVTWPTATGAETASPVNTGTPSGCPAAVATGAFTPDQLLHAYGIDQLHASGFKGQGRRVAIIVGGPPDPGDLSAFLSCFGITAVQPTLHQVGSALPNNPEADLDVQALLAVAPEVERLDVFHGGGGMDELVAAALDPANTGGAAVDVISMSLGVCESAWTGFPPYQPILQRLELLFAAAAAQGTTVVAASGDSGSTYPASAPCFVPVAGPSTQYPATSPSVVAVGATSIALDAGNNLTGETVWNDTVWPPPDHHQLATGGGVSAIFPRPTWQTGPGVDANAMRQVPDVALFGDGAPGITMMCSSCIVPGWNHGGGTSLATPLFAGLFAVVEQATIAAGQPAIGFAGPVLYDVANTTGGSVFRDVTTGTNDITGSGCCTAGPGYDLASGWGSVWAPGFVNALGPPTAVLTAGNPSGTGTVTLSASGSTSPGGSIVRYDWDTDGDGSIDHTTNVPTLGVVYTPGTTANPTVTITTSLHRTAFASTTIVLPEPNTAVVTAAVAPPVAATPVVAIPAFTG